MNSMRNLWISIGLPNCDDMFSKQHCSTIKYGRNSDYFSFIFSKVRQCLHAPTTLGNHSNILSKQQFFVQIHHARRDDKRHSVMRRIVGKFVRNITSHDDRMPIEASVWFEWSYVFEMLMEMLRWVLFIHFCLSAFPTRWCIFGVSL